MSSESECSFDSEPGPEPEVDWVNTGPGGGTGYVKGIGKMFIRHLILKVAIRICQELSWRNYWGGEPN